MNNALTFVPQPKISETKCFDVVLERKALRSRVGFFDELSDILEVLPRRSRDILTTVWSELVCKLLLAITHMICCCKGAVRPPDLPVSIAETFERLLRAS